MKKIIALILFLILLSSISGCQGKKDVKKSIEELRTGTEGIVANFLPNNPPPLIHADQPSFDVVLELNNKGAYPQLEDTNINLGKIYLSGYDPNILKFEKNSFELKPIELQGKSLINLNGGSQLVTFKAEIKNLNVEKYEPILLATVCYPYITIAGPSVCIDPDPYSTIKQKKVCEVKDITLSSQGAPIAITMVGEEAFALKTQFKITIKNVGSGDVIKSQTSGPSAIDKCDPFGSSRIDREDIDKVYLEEVSLGQKALYCWPFAEGTVKAQTGVIRLLNGEGSIVCELLKEENKYAGGNTAYTTPLSIRLSYVYKNTAQRQLQIKQETSSLKSTTPPASDSSPTS